MRIKLLKMKPGVYSSNVYLVRGTWNRISDINTLIDVGTDGSVIDEIEEINTGVGKKKVDQVILTHEHFDHAGALKDIIKKYNPKVYAYKKIEGVTHQLKDNKYLRIGNEECLIIHTPGHTHDSVCIYCEKEKILFSGDTTIHITGTIGSYDRKFVKVFERLTKLNIDIIYPGHGKPINYNVQGILNNSYENILKSKIIE